MEYANYVTLCVILNMLFLTEKDPPGVSLVRCPKAELPSNAPSVTKLCHQG